MKIIASIPVERILSPYGSSFTYASALHEVEVVRVIRHRTSNKVKRYVYEADIKDHPAMCPEAIRIGGSGLHRVCIVRSLNKRWKPPVFADGRNVYEVPNESR